MKQALCLLFFLSACKPSSFFISPNEVHKEKVVLYLNNHLKENGEISISMEENSSMNAVYKPYIQFFPEGKSTEEKISLNDIAGYSLDSDFYVLKKVEMFRDDIYNLLFVKRLTAENSKIQLYELYESGRGNATGESKYSYFLSFPSYGPLKTLNTISHQVVPMFDQKMSMFVSDCPALANKIKAKEKGYFIPFGSFKTFQRREVLMKIIDEYNHCN